jgi:hypothetical protein
VQHDNWPYSGCLRINRTRITRRRNQRLKQCIIVPVAFRSVNAFGRHTINNGRMIRTGYMSRNLVRAETPKRTRSVTHNVFLPKIFFVCGVACEGAATHCGGLHAQLFLKSRWQLLAHTELLRRDEHF